MFYLLFQCLLIIFCGLNLGYSQVKQLPKSSSKLHKPKYQHTLIGFYNLENLFDTVRDYRIFDQDFTPEGDYHYTSEIYQQKLANLAWVIRNMGANKYSDGLGILGVAEVENRKVLEDLVARPELKDRDYKIIHHDGHDRRGIDVGLLYRSKYFAPYKFRSIPIFLPKRKKKKHGYYTRDILQVSGLLASKDTTHIFVIHLPSRLGGRSASEPARVFVTKKVRHIIDSIQQIHPQHRFIVMGDMNDNPDNSSINEVLYGLPKQDNFPPQALFNPYYAIHAQGIGTLVYKDIWFLFDQILLSSQFLEKNSSSFFHRAYIFNPIVLTETLGKNKGYPKRTFVHKTYNEGYSDHYPVFIVLKIPIPE